MIERFLDGLREKMQDPVDCTCMTIAIPGDIDPLERHYRYSIHIDAELRLTGMGCSAGGGTLFRESEDGESQPETCYCLLDVDATDVDGARALIRLHMPELGIPGGTLLQWSEFEDRFDGECWRLNCRRNWDEFDL